jgi:hypothetical protein
MDVARDDVPPRGARTAPRRVRAQDHGSRRAVHPRRHRRRDHRDGHELRRLPRCELHAEARRPLSARDLHERRVRRLGRSAGASAATAVYFNNPMDYTSSTSEATTSTGCARARPLLLVCGQGQWEDTTAPSSRRSGSRGSSARRDPHELDLWGHDVPHDWPSWRAHIAHHLPRFV